MKYLKTTHPQYPKWQEYLAARSQWEEQQAEEFREKERRLREEIAWWKSLDGKTFEKEIADFLRKLGYGANLTSYVADGGIDIQVRDGVKKIIVQCKAHRTSIGPAIVRELYGTIVHGKADEGWLITTCGFSSGARDFARGKPIKLITIEEFLSSGTPKARSRNVENEIIHLE